MGEDKGERGSVDPQGTGWNRSRALVFVGIYARVSGATSRMGQEGEHRESHPLLICRAYVTRLDTYPSRTCIAAQRT